MGARNIFLLVVLVLVLVFVLQNTDGVNIHFFFWKATLSLAIVLIGSVAFGLATGWLIGTFKPKRKDKAG